MRPVGQEFERFYRRAPQVLASAPGTVLLLGEDSDGHGLVIGAATAQRIQVAVAARSDRRAFVRTSQTGGEVALSLDKPERTWGWADHVAAVVAALDAEGRVVPGFEMLFEGEVPTHAGLGSSIALELAAVTALDALAGLGLDAMARARVCQRAQQQFLGAGEPLTGPAIAACAREGHVVVVDESAGTCRPLALELSGHSLVALDSGLRKPASQTEKTRRSEQVGRALQALRVKRPQLSRLRDATPEELDTLDSALAGRARRVVSEANRVAIACEALEEGELAQRASGSRAGGPGLEDAARPQGELVRLGALMTESHDSLRLHVGVSPPELDGLTRLAQTSPGVLGARLMREGDTGCVVALVLSESVEELKVRVESRHYRRFGRQGAIWTLERAGAGARVD